MMVSDEAVEAFCHAMWGGEYDEMSGRWKDHHRAKVRRGLAAAVPLLTVDAIAAAWEAAATGADDADELPKLRWWLGEQARIARQGGTP